MFEILCRCKIAKKSSSYLTQQKLDLRKLQSGKFTFHYDNNWLYSIEIHMIQQFMKKINVISSLNECTYSRVRNKCSLWNKCKHWNICQNNKPSPWIHIPPLHQITDWQIFWFFILVCIQKSISIVALPLFRTLE